MTSTVEPTPQQDADLQGGIDYWATQAANDDGVMGGYGHLSQVDALSSRMFLLTVVQRLSTVSTAAKKAAKNRHNSGINGSNTAPRQRVRALDVACGIGRVSANTLLPLVDEVHLVEPVEHYIKEAYRAASTGNWRSLKNARADAEPKACHFYQASLQEFDPSNPQGSPSVGSIGQEEQDRPGYDVIWAQWGLGHLSDEQLLIFLRKCKAALRTADSVIVVKENVTHPSLEREYDEQDKSWTRSCAVWEDLFKKADLTIVRKDEQKGFPAELFAIWMYALR